MNNKSFLLLKLIVVTIMLCVFSNINFVNAQDNKGKYLFHDAHFHLTNYVQEGIGMEFYVDSIMGDKVGRSTVFGLPLQQIWSYRVTKDFAPTYYLDTDAPLYYYSFCDAYIAAEYLKLPKEKQARLDPMIIGFNVSDMYAADHIKRVLKTFPGVFSGIGEFSIHKEFVSSKVSGDVASFYDPALDRILEFCAESGLLAIVHNDIDNPFPKPGKPNYLTGMQDLVKRHPNTTIVWAHLGLGRVVRPIEDMGNLFLEMLEDPAYRNFYFDLSWDETAKWLMSSEKSIAKTTEVITKYPDKFMFGTDNVAPDKQEKQLNVYHAYDPLWKALGEEITYKVCIGNYERLFDDARVKVRKWEKENVK